MKTESKHTPGPWKVDWETGLITSDHYTLGEFYGADLSEDDLAYEECKANAELIAQAPQLLSDREELLNALGKMLNKFVDQLIFEAGVKKMTTLETKQFIESNATYKENMALISKLRKQ